jgi:hypothetical protein
MAQQNWSLLELGFAFLNKSFQRLCLSALLRGWNLNGGKVISSRHFQAERHNDDTIRIQGVGGANQHQEIGRVKLGSSSDLLHIFS